MWPTASKESYNGGTQKQAWPDQTEWQSTPVKTKWDKQLHFCQQGCVPPTFCYMLSEHGVTLRCRYVQTVQKKSFILMQITFKYFPIFFATEHFISVRDLQTTSFSLLGHFRDRIITCSWTIHFHHWNYN